MVPDRSWASRVRSAPVTEVFRGSAVGMGRGALSPLSGPSAAGATRHEARDDRLSGPGGRWTASFRNPSGAIPGTLSPVPPRCPQSPGLLRRLALGGRHRLLHCVPGRRGSNRAL